MKKFIPYILIMAIVGVGVLGPISQAMAAAQGNAIKNPGISGWSCNPVAFNLGKCAAVVSYTIFFIPTSAVLWFGGQIFNISVAFSLDGKTLDNKMVTTGWKASRDLVNLFFIFILLYIAIATILQISGYGIKDLLVKVIIIALLVNFSLLATKVVIDASNIMAIEFYESMTADGGIVTKFVGGSDARDISRVFMKGFDPQELFSAPSFQNWQKNTGGDFIALFLLFILAAILNLVAAFVLFAGAILFIIRIVVLWLLMILSPLAFLAMAMPAMKEHASKWWSSLFNQSFFAPVFLFLFYLVTIMIAPPDVSDGFLKSMAKGLADVTADSSQTGIYRFLASIGVIVVQFTALAVLVIAALIISKQMSGKIGQTIMKSAETARKKAQGYAGKISKRGAGVLAEGMLKHVQKEPEGKFAKSLNLMPGVTRGLARASSWREQQIKEKEAKYKKTYGSYSPAGLAAMTQREFGATEIGLATIGQGPRITEAKRKAIEDVKKEKREKAKKIARQAELRRIADDQSLGEIARLSAMKLLGELDVQTELERTKAELEGTKTKLESEKARASAAKEGSAA